ncbi:MAG TPA: DUF4199 domain-containing protein [Mucilaginibacter sp.]|nr:DUF4199 domain-containing protein [Mucilaginibacter sp.]
MKKIVIVCGLIAGVISCSWGIFGEQFLDSSVSMNTRLFFGYASMVLAFSLIYVGVKSYRDKQGGGFISFGKALKISLLITLVASTVYVVLWMIDYYFFIPDFGKKYVELVRSDMVAKGASQAAIQKEVEEMTKTMQWYRNPFFNALITYSEIVPVGVIISLIVSLILKNRSKPAPASV